MLRAFFLSLILLAAAAPVYAGVVINEVAWMGTKESATNEWVELYSEAGQNLDGWILATEDGGMNLRLRGTTTAGGYYLIERTDDKTLPDIKADLVASFRKGLSNDGEVLILKDASGVVVDRVDGSNLWAIGGDKDTKTTLQKNINAPGGWITALATPRAKNADYTVPKPVQPAFQKTAQPKAGATEKAASAQDEKTKENFSASTLNTEPPSPSGDYYWLAIGLGVGVLAGAAFLFAKRYFP